MHVHTHMHIHTQVMWLKLAVEKEQSLVHKEQSKVQAHKAAAEEEGRLAA